MFVCQGHWVKVKVTGAKNELAVGLSLIESQCCLQYNVCVCCEQHELAGHQAHHSSGELTYRHTAVLTDVTCCRCCG